MKADLKEVSEILRNLQECCVEIRGIVYENRGNSDYQLQKSFRGIEFYVLQSELERHCKNTLSEPLTIFVKLKETTSYYKIIR